jgi:hypothetical protein
MDTQIVADHFKQNVDWSRFVNLVASIGDQFDESQWRFLKARIFENSLQAYSDGSVKYVGEEGCDLIVNMKKIKNVRVEMKFIRNAFFSPKRMKMKDVCYLSLMSTQGTNKHKNLPTHYADYLLVVSNNCAGLIDKKSLMKYTTMRGDGIVATVPSNKMNMLFTPLTFGESKIYNIDLRGAIDNAIQKVIQQVK